MANKIKLSFKEIKEYIENEINCKLLSEDYKGVNCLLKIQTSEGYLAIIKIINLRNGHDIGIFQKSNPYVIDNIKQWLILNKKNFQLISNNYNGNKDKLTFITNEGYYFSQSWTNLMSGKNYNVFSTFNPYTIQNIKLWLNLNNIKLKLLTNTYKGSDKKLLIKCLNTNCENKFKITWDNLKQGCGCPECNKSKGEKECVRIFDFSNFIRIKQKDYDKLSDIDKKLNKYYIPQKEFDNLVGLGNGLLSYDFYLPNYNLLIEYQGEQHEKYIKGFHKSKKDFEKQVEHDRRKREYAQINNINLLEIWYWDYDNIEEILQKLFNKEGEKYEF